MKQLISGSYISIFILLILAIIPTIVSADHQVGHYDIELPENYYDYLPLTSEDGEGVEIYVTSSQNIDILLLTDEMFSDCCSDNTVENYEYIAEGSVLNTNDYHYVIENGVGPIIIIFDHTSEPTGGASPSGSVNIELTLIQLEENVFEFHWQNLALSLIFIPLSLVLIIESVRPGVVSSVVNHKTTLKIKKEIADTRMAMTYTIIFVNTLFFISRYIFSPEEDNLLEYTEWGAMAAGSVFDGNLFSIISANFFHFDLLHLAGNIFAIYIMGRYLERKFGSIRFLGVLLAGGICSSVLSLFYDPLIASGGASGMVFCTFGVVLMEWLLDLINSSKNKFCQWHDMQWFWGTIILNAGISFVPGVSLLGHLGGLLGGMGITLLMVKIGTHPEARDDQLIKCPSCDFSFPVIDMNEDEFNNCPKCGVELVLQKNEFTESSINERIDSNELENLPPPLFQSEFSEE